MSNFIERLKILPWRSLLQSAALTSALTAVLELALAEAIHSVQIIENALRLLYSPPLGTFMVFLVPLGMGALSVYWLEMWQQQYILNASSLWALVACLLFTLFIKTLLPIPPILVGLSQLTLIGIMIGVFWKGRSYWR